MSYELKYTKTVLYTFMFVITAFLVISPFCNINETAASHTVQECSVELLQQTDDYFIFFKTQSQIILTQAFQLKFILPVSTIFLLSFFYKFIRRYHAQPPKNYYLIPHMKPWDPLRFAFARGLIHNKHLD